MPLIYNNEKKLYWLIAVFSILIWGIVLIASFGLLLLYLPFGFLFYLFAHSTLIAHLKGNGIKVSTTQYPELYQQYRECCHTLDFAEEPEIYILNSDGILNALATKFLSKHYVVLYSSVLDALKNHPAALNFYIGHELGHIKRGHLNYGAFIWPGMLLPLVGSAYSRAREYSCDLHGLKCCKQPKDAAFGLAVLAAGPGHWSKLGIPSYISQCDETAGFWMSFNELTADYPWLCKRVKHVVSVSEGKQPDFPTRSFAAGLLALLIPRTGAGGGAGNLIVTVALIGILAAVALPAYQDYTIRAKAVGVEMLGDQIKQKVSPYILENGELPQDLLLVDLPQNLSNDVVESVEVSDNGFELTLKGHAQLDGQTVIYVPYFDDNERLQWRCNEGTLAQKYRPNSCK